jgi:ABC-type nitrate/sulfonate/bicarbonate transport system substrate-binding protein
MMHRKTEGNVVRSLAIRAVMGGLRAGVLGLLAIAAAAVPVRAQQRDHATLALPAIALIFVADYVAEDQHLWQKEGLDVKVVFITGVGALNAVISGGADFSMSSGLTLNRAAARGQKMLAIANTVERPVVELVLRKDLADAGHFDPAAPLAQRALLLRGRTIAIDSVNSVVHAYARVIAKAGGFDVEDMRVAPMQPADMLGALQRKAIDGFSFGPPWPEKVEVEGLAVALASGVKGDPPGFTPIAYNVVVTRPKFCTEHRSVCMKMGRGIVAAVTFIREHPQETLALLKKRYPDLGEPVLASSLEAMRAATPRVPSVSAAELETADRLNVAAGLLKPADKLSSFDDLFTNDFVH